MSGIPTNKTFDGNVEPIRLPHISSLIEDTQALHLSPQEQQQQHFSSTRTTGHHHQQQHLSHLQQQQQQQSHHLHSERIRLSADAAEFVPNTYHHPQEGNLHNPYVPSFQPQQSRYGGGGPGLGGGGGGGGHRGYGGGGGYGHHQYNSHHHPAYSSSGRDNSRGGSVQNRLHHNNSMFQSQQNHQVHSSYHQQQVLHPSAYQQQHHHHNPHHQHHQQFSEMQQTHQRQSEDASDYGEDDHNQQQQQQSQEEVHALGTLREVMRQLSDKPGMFEEYSMELKEAFADVLESHLVMSCAVEMLFEQSVAEPNFRYMGARLCQVLDILAAASQPNLFREMLGLKLAHHETELPAFMAVEQGKVRGTALFLSDLYIQLQSEGDRMPEIGRCILLTLKLLLGKEGPENAKCVCQALKLCGYELESDSPEEVDAVMQMLAEMVNVLETSASRLIEYVLNLRVSRWGRKNIAPQPSSSRTAAGGYNPYESTDGPVFYGPDGQVLTEDEASFLTANSATNFLNGNMPQSPHGGNNSSSGASMSADRGDPMLAPLDLSDLNAEMDAEMQEAYRQFVRGSK